MRSERRFAIAILMGVLCSFGCMCGMCGGCASRDDVDKSIKRADSAWEGGDKDSRAKDAKDVKDANEAREKEFKAKNGRAMAVAEYKKLYGERNAEKAEKAKFLSRIVEFEIGKDNIDEAKRWIDRGVADGIEVDYADAKAKEILALGKKEHEKRQAELAAAKEAERQAESRRRDKIRSETLVNGDAGYIDVEGQSIVLVAINEQADKELTSFAVAKNEDAIRQMMVQGRVFVCAKHTRVSVVDHGFFTTTIRIMDGKHAGATGIIANEFLHKRNSPEAERRPAGVEPKSDSVVPAGDAYIGKNLNAADSAAFLAPFGPKGEREWNSFNGSELGMTGLVQQTAGTESAVLLVGKGEAGKSLRCDCSFGRGASRDVLALGKDDSATIRGKISGIVATADIVTVRLFNCEVVAHQTTAEIAAARKAEQERRAAEDAARAERDRRAAERWEAERPERERREAAQRAERERKAEADRAALIEKDAATILRLARDTYDVDKAKARRDLEALIKKYPNTKAAAEAKRLLKVLFT